MRTMGSSKDCGEGMRIMRRSKDCGEGIRIMKEKGLRGGDEYYGKQ